MLEKIFTFEFTLSASKYKGVLAEFETRMCMFADGAQLFNKAERSVKTKSLDVLSKYE